MQPRDQDIRNLAIYAPRFAFALIAGVPRVPLAVDIPLQFTSSAVNAPPVTSNFSNNLTQDTLVERVAYNLSQPNTFPGSPFQSLYFNQKKQSGTTGVGVQFQVYGGPKYVINDTFTTDLGNLVDVFAMTWPQGWPLYRQSNVKVLGVLLETPVSVPYDVTITFLGWQFLDKTIDDMSDDDARAKLRKLGFETPDLGKLLG